MSKKKIVYLSDFDWSGSGYKSISIPICKGLSELGHEVKAVGLSYKGEEHDYNFSIIPANDLQNAYAYVHNLQAMWNPDVIIVALDIPLQHQFISQLAKVKKKYIAITPLENGPLTISWAAGLFGADYVFFISELGKQEALKVGLKNVGHLQIGIDSNEWHIPTKFERETIRKNLGIVENEFVILTVADNQERKNLWAALSVTSKLKKENIGRPIRHILVTREHSNFGWKLRDLAVSLDINQELHIFERGMDNQKLWGLYSAADVFLLTSKAEGLGLPVMEAMACGLPVYATNTGALPELLKDGLGMLISSEYSITDVWGNSKRDFINIQEATNQLKVAATIAPFDTTRAREYIEKDRNWSVAIKQVDDLLQEICVEKEIPQ